MARLQILELPEGSGDDRTPFVLVVDQYVARHYITGLDQPEPVSEFDGITEKVGARAVLVFEETVDIPANDATGYLRESEAEERVEPQRADERAVQAEEKLKAFMDKRYVIEQERKAALLDALGMDRTRDWDDILKSAADLRQDRDEARSWARHGYEIGQRHCGWTDHGVAPEWLAEAWPPSFDSCEHLKQAAELDEALARVRAVSTEPEVMNSQQEHPGTWKRGYHCGVLAAKGAAQPRNEPTVKPAEE